MVEDVVLEDTLTAQDNTDKYNQGIKILKSRWTWPSPSLFHIQQLFGLHLCAVLQERIFYWSFVSNKARALNDLVSLKIVGPLLASQEHTVSPLYPGFQEEVGSLPWQVGFLAEAQLIMIMDRGTRYTVFHWQGYYIHWRLDGLYPSTRTFLHGGCVCV